MTKLKNCVGLFLALGALLLIFSQLPLGTAFELGDDEGFEVIKGFMCFKGFTLYKDIWNDQPPVSTVLLTNAFKAFGPSIVTARLVAAGFGLILVAAFHELVRNRSGSRCALLATFFLLASPGVLLLSVSVMLEVPAISMGLLSAWLLLRWEKQTHWAWLLGSGAVMAVALQIKLTAALVLPAILVELALLSRGKATLSWLRDATPRALLWGASAAVVFTIIGVTWGKGSLDSSWKSHTTAQIVPGLDRAEDHKFEPRLLSNHIECVMASAVCVIVAVWRKRLRELAFPVVLLLTASIIHTIHRPWWNYYYLHLAVPLAWLTGWIVNELIQRIYQLHEKSHFKISSRVTWQMLGLCALVALAIARSESRLESTVKDIRTRPSAEANPIVKKMKQLASRTKWAYSESGIYPFHANLAVPPDLTIVMPKRFWSGQITTRKIVETCKRYQPELLVLPMAGNKAEWKDLLDAEYVVTSIDTKSVLYVAKRVSELRSP